jgi:peroxiredoxin
LGANKKQTSRGETAVKNSQIWTWIACAAVAVSLGCGKRNESAGARTSPSPAQPGQSGSATVGNPAPDWQLNDLDGKSVKLSDFHAKKGVLLAFFATWCPYCMEEVPNLIAFQTAYKDRSVELIGVDLDQPAHVVKRFAEERKTNYKLLLDPGGQVATAYGIVGIPTIVGIDATGTVRYVANGLPKDLDALVKQLEAGGTAEVKKP